MDVRQQVFCKELRRVSSTQAADWLIGVYPLDSDDWGEAMVLLPHRSWGKAEQKRLAEHFFKKLPFSSYRGYESFTSIMSIVSLVGYIEKALPEDTATRELLLYYLVPVLNRAAKNEADRQAISKFVLGVV